MDILFDLSTLIDNPTSVSLCDLCGSVVTIVNINFCLTGLTKKDILVSKTMFLTPYVLMFFSIVS